MRIIDQSAPSPIARPTTRFVMKRALNNLGEQGLISEIRVLRRLRGAPNIQQLFRVPGETIDLEVPYWRGPTLFTEWIPNGLVNNFVQRRDEWGDPLPNRMLWRFFLCFCYMLVAMAWPPEGQEDAPSSKGYIPLRNRAGDLPPESHLVHGDLNVENVMFGDFEPIAHQFVPMLKLIDFGKSQTILEGPIPGIKRNMQDIGTIMVRLIGGNVFSARDLENLGHPNYRMVDKKTKDMHQERLNNLDPELKSLIALCLAANAADRPELDHLLQEVQSNVNEKTPDSYQGNKYHHNESDAALRRISEIIIRLAQSPR
ncbi:hypothetical protein F5Y06DRAFT_291084 [Hypoxylon sp. FL0890]|nr:hypothetical protein F5Y06DRAFT_291084 [Hypoxylon sp. FL0890]